MWRRPPASPKALTAAATAAVTSAAVTLLTMWLWNQGSVTAPGFPWRRPPTTQTPIVVLAESPLVPLTASVAPARRDRIAQTRPRAVVGEPGAQQAVAGNGSHTLEIVTDPEGARVTINGVGWGTTPLSVRNLPPGDLHVRLTKAGYISEERLLRGDAAPVTLRVALHGVP